MAKIIILSFLALISLSQGLRLSPKELTTEEILEKNPTLTFLGQVGQKRFFHDVNDVTWGDANRYCKEIGMTLVALDTQEEFEFLKNNQNFPEFYTKFWTSGHDSHDRSNYKWGNGQTIGSWFEWDDTNDDYLAESVYMSVPGGVLRSWRNNYGQTIVCQL